MSSFSKPAGSVHSSKLPSLLHENQRLKLSQSQLQSESYHANPYKYATNSIVTKNIHQYKKRRRPESIDYGLAKKLSFENINIQISRFQSPIVLNSTDTIAHKISFKFGNALRECLLTRMRFICEVFIYILLLNWTISWCFFLHVMWNEISFLISIILLIIPIFFSTNVNIQKYIICTFYGCFFMFHGILFPFCYAYIINDTWIISPWYIIFQ